MNVEKYTGSKLYSFFEWLFKLILWNILLILIIMTLSIGPFYGFYKIQDNNLIDNIEFIDNGLIITQKNNKKTTVENFFGEFKSSDITIQKDDDNYTLQVKLENDVIITYSLKEEYKDIYLDNGSVIGTNSNNEIVIIDEVLDVNPESYNIDRNRCLILSYNEGNKVINFGTKVGVQNGLASAFLVAGVIIAVAAFIPLFVTVFSMIKIYGDNEGSASILLFFDRLWDNFKALYKLELIMIPVVCLFTFATYFYYVNIINSQTLGSSFESIYVIGYNFLLVSLIIIVLCLLNLPMTLGYFRMNTKSIMKFTFIMTFKNILYTFIYLFSFLMPILLCLFLPVFIPIWFLCGISLPLYFSYVVSRTKYRYLVNILEAITDELSENTDIYKYTDKERGIE